MFAVSVEENIAYGVESYTQEELHAATRLAHAHDFISNFSDGWEGGDWWKGDDWCEG